MKLHLGCGNRYLPGYIHVDAQVYEHVSVVCELKDLPHHFEKETVDEIYACHVLEHIDRHAIENTLKMLRMSAAKSKTL